MVCIIAAVNREKNYQNNTCMTTITASDKILLLAVMNTNGILVLLLHALCKLINAKYIMCWRFFCWMETWESFADSLRTAVTLMKPKYEIQHIKYPVIINRAFFSNSQLFKILLTSHPPTSPLSSLPPFQTPWHTTVGSVLQLLLFLHVSLNVRIDKSRPW